MILSAFDTGISTGAILVEFDDEGNIQYVKFKVASPEILQEVAEEYIQESSHVLIERIPLSSKPKLHFIQNIVFMACDKFETPFTLIFPGIWKPFAKKKWVKTLSSQHIQDAYDMLKYHVFFNHGLLLGDLYD